MQFAINRETLLRPLQLVSGSLGGRPTLPILSNVLLNVDEDRLSMTGTDLEVAMIGRVMLEPGTQAGKTTVPARKLLDICRGLPESATISFQLEADRRTRLGSGAPSRAGAGSRHAGRTGAAERPACGRARRVAAARAAGARGR